MRSHRIPLSIIVRITLLTVLVGCAHGPTADKLSAENILAAFKTANLPIQNTTIYTSETDPNKLLAKPNQYIGKAGWSDYRVKDLAPGALTMTVEIFATSQDLEDRRKQIASVVPAEYQFAHKNALLRLNQQLTPLQAAEYERVLKSL